MFIADRRPTSRRLRAGAALLAGLIPTTLTFALLATSQDVLPLSDERAEVVFFEEAPPAAPGPAVAAPPGPTAEGPQPRPALPPEPEPEPETEPAPFDDGNVGLLDERDAPVVAALSPAGDGGGGGGCETEPCDPAGCNGPDCESRTPGPTAVHWSKVTVKRQVPPKMPAAARPLGPMDQKCTVRMTIDDRGRVTHVDPIDCPPMFHDSAVTAAAKWRFEPMKVDGRSVDATFLLTIRYRVE